jgi:flagellar biosynthesis protein FlhF
VASVPASLRIVVAESGASSTLAKRVAGLSFSAPQPVIFREKMALLSGAEVMVNLRADSKDASVGAASDASMLRCGGKRMVDASTGKALVHSYLLASAGIEASAAQIVQWAAWRAVAEPYFKLLNQGLLQLSDGRAPGEVIMLKRVLIAAQASITVFRLQQAQDDWAETARKVLTQLTGRSVRTDRPMPGSALFEGLGKLFVLLDAMETDEAAVSPQSDLTPVQR